MIPLNNSKVCADRFRDLWDHDLATKELIYVIFLDNKRRQKSYKQLCAGNRSSCGFDILETIFQCYTNASNHIIIAHNHPSGIALPSDIDIELTRSIHEILARIDIVLVDHIILTVDDHYSFRDNGFFDVKQKSA